MHSQTIVAQKLKWDLDHIAGERGDGGVKVANHMKIASLVYIKDQYADR
jgi:hypothetical protein